MLNQLEVRRPSSKPPLQCPKVATKGRELLTNHPRESDIPPAKRTPPPLAVTTIIDFLAARDITP